MRNNNRAIVTLLMVAFIFSMTMPACSGESLRTASQAVPGVEFTKIQDINPNAPATNRPVKQKWALVVGASKFKESRLNPVAANDMDESAREFSAYLTDQQSGRFDPKHVRMLINSGATKQNVMSALGPAWLGSVAGPDDLVVVYIATSAFPTTDGNTYLCAYDCALDNIYGTCISMLTLMDTLKKNVRSDRVLLVLQAGYSGAAELDSGAKALFNGFNINIEKIALGKGYVILSSSRANQITWGSNFSRNLISALKMEDGLIALTKAFAIAKQKTEQETAAKDPDRIQTPVFKSNWMGNDLVLGTPPLEKVAELPEPALTMQSAEASYLKATQLLTSGKVDEALVQYKAAIDANPNYADALGDYGAALALKDDWQAASQIYQRAIAVSPNDSLFHFNFARVLEKLGRDEMCDAELETAYRLNPRDSSILLAISARSLKSNDMAKAIKILREAIALYPNYSNLHERLSYAEARSGNLVDALIEARESVRLAPMSASAQMNLGSVLMLKGDFVSSIKAYREAEQISSNDPEVHLLLSKALERNGNRAEAINELSQFIRFVSASDPRITGAKQHLQDLSKRD